MMRSRRRVGIFSDSNQAVPAASGLSAPSSPPSKAICRRRPSMRSYPNLRVVRRRTSGRNGSSASGVNSGDARNASSASYSSPICAPSARTPTRPTTSSALMGTRSPASRGGGRKEPGSSRVSGTRPGPGRSPTAPTDTNSRASGTTSGSRSARRTMAATLSRVRRLAVTLSRASPSAARCTCALGKERATPSRGSRSLPSTAPRPSRRTPSTRRAFAFDPMSAPSQLRAKSSRSRRPAFERAVSCPTARVTVGPTGEDMRAHRAP